MDSPSHPPPINVARNTDERAIAGNDLLMRPCTSWMVAMWAEYGIAESRLQNVIPAMYHDVVNAKPLMAHIIPDVGNADAPCEQRYRT